MSAPRGRPARLALVIACVLLVALLGLQVWTEGPVTRADAAVTTWLALHRDAALTRAMLLVSEAHETVKLLGVTGMVAAWLAIRREWRLAARLLVVPAGMLLNFGLKHVFLRPRPQLEEPLVQIATLSFPSGHAVASTVLYGVLCSLVFAHTRSPAWRAAALVAALVLVLLVTFSRVYLGAHYLSDVVAGVAVGTLCLGVVLGFDRRR